MDSLLQYINFQLKNGEGQVSGAILKKSKTGFMTFETGFSVHINFAGQKMKVKLAEQMMSNSVADSLLDCRDVLLLENFADCRATVYFIRLIIKQH
jgi:hypothetical protein